MDERDRIKPDDDDDSATEAPGDVLGIAHVRATGRGWAADEAGNRGEGEEDRAGGTGNEDRSHVGTRDVTEGTTGGTGPDTGGAGALRKGSGATGTDLGS